VIRRRRPWRVPPSIDARIRNHERGRECGTQRSDGFACTGPGRSSNDRRQTPRLMERALRLACEHVAGAAMHAEWLHGRSTSIQRLRATIAGTHRGTRVRLPVVHRSSDGNNKNFKDREMSAEGVGLTTLTCAIRRIVDQRGAIISARFGSQAEKGVIRLLSWRIGEGG